MRNGGLTRDAAPAGGPRPGVDNEVGIQLVGFDETSVEVAVKQVVSFVGALAPEHSPGGAAIVRVFTILVAGDGRGGGKNWKPERGLDRSPLLLFNSYISGEGLDLHRVSRKGLPAEPLDLTAGCTKISLTGAFGTRFDITLSPSELRGPALPRRETKSNKLPEIFPKKIWLPVKSRSGAALRPSGAPSESDLSADALIARPDRPPLSRPRVFTY
ncbi:hypothetical protein EVAR_37928_1 [Eumeta japonica]|uniref:Uncharacterized protein n=1 Tax=Eumeta variegata TaxID=151549 RepID=A0A4C1XGR8_EUMVA|nr:hypothetical protein EVAR_37928_1 [Eumeta japonica]